MPKRWLVAIALLLAWPAALAAAPNHLTIKEAVLLAVRQNPQARSAQLQRTIDKFQLEVARNEFSMGYHLSGEIDYTSGRDPATSVTPSISRKFGLGTQATLTSKQDFHGRVNHATLAVDQPLLRGVGLAVNLTTVSNAEDQESVNKLSLHNFLMDTVNNTLRAYRRLVEDFERKRIQTVALKQAEQVLHEYALKVKVGQLPRASLEQQQTQVVSQQLALEAQENTIKRDYQALLFVLGLDPKSRLEIDNQIAPDQTKLPSLKDSIAQAMAHNVAYRQQLIALAAKRRSVTVAKNAQLWDLDAHGTIDTDGTKTASLKLDVPIDDVSRKAQLATAKVALQQAEIAVKQARDELETQVTDLWRGLKSQQHQIALANSKAKLATKIYHISVKSRMHGLASAFEVVRQQQAMVSSQIDVFNRRISYLGTLATFQKALGQTLQVWGIDLPYAIT